MYPFDQKRSLTGLTSTRMPITGATGDDTSPRGSLLEAHGAHRRDLDGC